MKKNSKNLAAAIIFFLIFILLSGCSKSHIIVGAAFKEKLVNGVYNGSYTQFPNRAAVKVTIKDNKIVNIQIISHYAWRGKKAEPPIVKEIIEKQSTKVDAVTGATNSSETIMKAVQIAVEKAYKEQRAE